jgi:membrane protein
LAPLLFVAVVVASIAFGRQAAEEEVLSEVKFIVGDDVASTLDNLISTAGRRRSGLVATFLAGVTILIGAVGFFCELQDAPNTVLKVPAYRTAGAWPLVRSPFHSFEPGLVVRCITDSAWNGD